MSCDGLNLFKAAHTQNGSVLMKKQKLEMKVEMNE